MRPCYTGRNRHPGVCPALGAGCRGRPWGSVRPWDGVVRRERVFRLDGVTWSERSASAPGGCCASARRDFQSRANPRRSPNQANVLGASAASTVRSKFVHHSRGKFPARTCTWKNDSRWSSEGCGTRTKSVTAITAVSGAKLGVRRAPVARSRTGSRPVPTQAGAT
jgi:hypothetical protein